MNKLEETVGEIVEELWTEAVFGNQLLGEFAEMAFPIIKKMLEAKDNEPTREHIYYECKDCGDQIGHCQYCDGGLSFCTVCKGGEGALPSECPGEAMGDLVEQAVYKGQLDFKGGRWILEPSMKCSFHHDLKKKEKP